MDINELKVLVPGSENWVNAEEITFGWSGEQKYKIIDEHKKEYLLRILTLEQFETQKIAIEFLEMCNKTITNIPYVYNHGKTKGDKYCYILLDYIVGQNGMEAIHNCTEDEQYALGFKMGKTLLALHQQTTPKFMLEESRLYEEKVRARFDYFLENQNLFDFISIIPDYVYAFLNKIKNRPYIMLHNDFHLGNMIINGEEIGLIDFNRSTFGDRARELDCIAWSATHSIHFATGLLDAYTHNMDNVSEFFELLKGYITIWEIQMLCFIADQDEEECKIVTDLIKFSDSWFEKNSNIPNWYLDYSRNLNNNF